MTDLEAAWLERKLKMYDMQAPNGGFYSTRDADSEGEEGRYYVWTPDEMRGRVASVNSIFVGSSNELGAFESGVTARLMGTVPAVVFGGTMTILIVVFTALTSPSMRRLELAPAADSER